MYIKRCFCLAAMMISFVFPHACLLDGDCRAQEFQVGVGRKVITPETPIWLSGYAARNKPATKVVHDLWAKALVIESPGGERAVIVTADLIALPQGVTDEAAAKLQQRFGLERAQLFFNASHTHSGPVVWDNLSPMFDLDQEQKERLLRYRNHLVEQLVDVVAAAWADRAPAKIYFGGDTAGFAANRRQQTEKGVVIGVNPNGPVDHAVPVLKITAPDGRLRAVLFGYACHNTTLGGDSYKVCGDYAGFAQLDVEKSYPGATAMFLALCGGDQNPHPRGTLELAQEHGKALAAAVARALSGEMRPLSPPVRCAYKVSRLDFAPYKREDFEKELKSDNKYQQNRARKMLAAYDAGEPVTHLALPVQVFRFGTELTLVGLGGEVVVDYALRLKRELPGENLIVAGYTNDVPCYIPSLAVLKGGGYEPVTSMMYYGFPGPLAENVEETVIAACRNLIDETKKPK